MITTTEPTNVRWHGHDWAPAMLTEVEAAQKSITLTAFSMYPPTPKANGAWPQLYHALEAAAARGLAVHVYLPAPTPIHPGTRANAGAGRALTGAGIAIHYVTGARLLHAKTVTIDDLAVWIGSGNFTAAAAHFNHEAFIRLDCAKFAQELQARWRALV